MAKLNVPVSKCKGGTIEIDTETLPIEMYTEALLQGLKSMLGRGMSKISKTTYPVEQELKDAAMAKAQENARAIMENDQKKIKLSGGTTKAKVSGALNTEAMRLARNLVKDEMKRQGIKISHVEASEITIAAKALVAADDSIIEQAKANLAEREKVNVGSKIDLKSLIKESPKLVAAAEARKAKAKGTLSAKQAGKPAVRTKPAATATVQ